MLFAAVLVLGYGPLNWSFPWWVWCLAILEASSKGYVTARRGR